MAKPRVLLTGATGYISAQLLPTFRERYDLRLIDVRREDRAGAAVAGVEVVDLLTATPAEATALFAGVDVVVHNGYQQPGGRGDSGVGDAERAARQRELYEGERRNIDLMQRVFELAFAQGVRRVVAASSNQAAKWYEVPYHRGTKDRVGPEDYPRPDNFYGWAKMAYEGLGFLYACGSLGRQLETVMIRIVAPRELDPAAYADQPLRQYRRDLAGYVSPRDLTQLYCKAIEAPEINDEHGVPFQIVYGVSNNARTFWSIANARRVLGYAPEDDAERYAAQVG